jgi:hypothetical protein
MKRFFTFFSLLLTFALGVKAQTTTWDFTASNPTWPAAGMGTDPVEFIDSKGLGLYNGTTNVNFGAWQTGQSASSWSAPNAVYTAGTVRVQTNGGGFSTGPEATPTQRYFFIQVNQACTVNVWFKSGSSSAQRSVIASDGTTEYGKATSVATTTTGFPTSGGFLSASITKAGTFFLYSDAAVNIYQLQVVGATVSLAPTNPLPVTFGGISAIASNGVVKVNWSILTEIDTKEYIVERSGDGVNFSSIGSLGANGVSNYNWLDNAPLSGNNFYRVKSVDNTGSINYSTTVEVNPGSNGSAQVIIAPNPVTNRQFNLQLNSLAQGDYALTIYSTSGQQVLSSVVSHPGGSSSRTITLPAIAKGLYNVHIGTFNKTIVVE